MDSNVMVHSQQSLPGGKVTAHISFAGEFPRGKEQTILPAPQAVKMYTTPKIAVVGTGGPDARCNGEIKARHVRAPDTTKARNLGNTTN